MRRIRRPASRTAASDTGWESGGLERRLQKRQRIRVHLPELLLQRLAADLKKSPVGKRPAHCGGHCLGLVGREDSRRGEAGAEPWQVGENQGLLQAQRLEGG